MRKVKSNQPIQLDPDGYPLPYCPLTAKGCWDFFKNIIEKKNEPKNS